MIRLYFKFIFGLDSPIFSIGIGLIAAAVLSGCGGGAGRLTGPTMTAQAERAIRQATQIARGSRQTQVAEEGRQQATAQAARLEVENWPVVLEDDFEVDSGVWILGTDESAGLAEIDWQIDGGVYRWEASAYDSFVWWVTPDAASLEDFYLQVDVRQTESLDVGERGVLFRQDDAVGYYTFELNQLGEFGMFFYDSVLESWQTVVDWQTSPSIRLGFVNTLTVVGRGDQFLLYINGDRVAEGRDARSAVGAVGLLIGLTNPGEAASWEFDDFILRAPELPATPETATPTP